MSDKKRKGERKKKKGPKEKKKTSSAQASAFGPDHTVREPPSVIELGTVRMGHTKAQTRRVKIKGGAAARSVNRNLAFSPFGR